MFVFYSKHNEEHKHIKTEEKQILSETSIIILKHGLKYEYNDRNPFYKTGDKEALDKHFKEHPENKDIFQVFKNTISESSE